MKKSQILELEKLRGKARAYAKEQDKLVELARQITGEEDESGFTFDYILNDFGTAEELLNRFNIEV